MEIVFNAITALATLVTAIVTIKELIRRKREGFLAKIELSTTFDRRGYRVIVFTNTGKGTAYNIRFS